MGIILNSMYYNEPTTSTAYNLHTWQAMYVVFYQVHKSTTIVFVHTYHYKEYSYITTRNSWMRLTKCSNKV